MRETWEEVGLDLADRDFLKIGQLDDREITSSLGKRLLMVLSPFGESGAAGPNGPVSGTLTETASHHFL
jgi:8-oxo-dGTP pyrophosphatase MutT (NUDIX family)